MALTPFDRSLAAIEAADKALARIEAGQTRSIESALTSSIKTINDKLRSKWGDRAGSDLFGRDRAILLANDLRDTLNVFNPTNPKTIALLAELEVTLKAAGVVGSDLAKDTYLDKSFGVSQSANISIDTARAVAQGAFDMLLGHGVQFASNASVAIQQGVLLGYGVQKTASMIKTLGGITMSRAKTIVRTETMRASADAANRRYAEDGIDQVIWIATQDRRTCQRCARLAGTIMPIDKAIRPLHPNDRCTVMAYRKEWDEAGLVDRDWMKAHSKSSKALAAQGYS